jgi:hypothetical protein
MRIFRHTTNGVMMVQAMLIQQRYLVYYVNSSLFPQNTKGA